MLFLSVQIMHNTLLDELIGVKVLLNHISKIAALAALTILVWPFSSSAQMSDDEMIENITDTIMKLSIPSRKDECLANLDKRKVLELKNKISENQDKIIELCANAQRDKAEMEAIVFESTVGASKTIRGLRRCGVRGKSIDPWLVKIRQNNTFIEENQTHICD